MDPLATELTEKKLMDPLVKELTEKKLSFKRNVLSLATELKDARGRLAVQHQLCARQAKACEAAEAKARAMEEQQQQLLSHLPASMQATEEELARLQGLLQATDLSQQQLRQRLLSLEDLDSLRAKELRDEMRILSAHWLHKSKDLDAQLDKQRRADQELKKKLLKLDFCLQESRSQIRKLHRVPYLPS